MDDNDIKKLFDGFDPQLSSDTLFMNRLQGSLHSVELLREQQARMRRNSRKAVAIAAVAGFVAGMLFWQAIPYVVEFAAGIKESASQAAVPGFVAENRMVLSWLAMGATSVFVALNAYELSLSLMKQKLRL